MFKFTIQDIFLKFGDEYRYEKKPKVMFFKEFDDKDSNEVNEENTNIAVSVDDEVVPIKQSFEIREVEEKIAAEGINKEKSNV